MFFLCFSNKNLHLVLMLQSYITILTFLFASLIFMNLIFVNLLCNTNQRKSYYILLHTILLYVIITLYHLMFLSLSLII